MKYTSAGGKICVTVIRQENFYENQCQGQWKRHPIGTAGRNFYEILSEPEVHVQNGVGIGLYLTRRILELQNGYIEVHSEIGKGSEFCLYLPN